MEVSDGSTVITDPYFPPLFPFGLIPSLKANRKMEYRGKVEKISSSKTATKSKKRLEKERRERMNMWIRRLKEIICQFTNEKERLNRSKTNQLWGLHQKWEKADVIELGVELLEESLNRLTKNDEKIKWNTFPSSFPSPSPTSPPPQSLPSLVSSQSIPHIRRKNQHEIWRPF